METNNAWLKKALVAAIVIYVIFNSLMQADLYWKVGKLEHDSMHLQTGVQTHD